MKKDDLKLCYVLKVGYDLEGKGHYEFAFSSDPSSIDTEACGWNEMPANGNANPPLKESIDLILSLKTDKIDFSCLHEMNDRAYIDGYYTIHCLAYENTDSENSDVMYDETPLLVFHYGMKATEVKNIFFTRDIQLKETEIVKSNVIAQEDEEEVEEDED